jgi:uncharacterized protein
MTQAAKAQEPSMEDILASIRRIIADDDAANPPPKPSDPPAMLNSTAPAPPQIRTASQPVMPAPASTLKRDEMADAEDPNSLDPLDNTQSDVLDLTEPMAVAAKQQADNIRRIDRSEVMVAHRPTDQREPQLTRAEPPRPLLSAATTTAVNSAFNALAQTVLVQNARTLEDLVKEMLRPLLKTWLDDNLPGLVERLVRAEIERVSRGRP